MLGLAEGEVVLVPHDPAWARAYAEEAERIRGALGRLALEVQHCGSTAIPGLRAKPILDVVVGVERLALRRECVGPLRGIGYEYLGEDVVPDAHFFGKGVPRTHHLHLVDRRGPRWWDKLLFRDRLLGDCDTARGYECLKLALADRFPRDRASYTKAKAGFIAGVVADGTVSRTEVGNRGAACPRGTRPGALGEEFDYVDHVDHVDRGRGGVAGW